MDVKNYTNNLHKNSTLENLASMLSKNTNYTPNKTNFNNTKNSKYFNSSKHKYKHEHSFSKDNLTVTSNASTIKINYCEKSTTERTDSITLNESVFLNHNKQNEIYKVK